MMQYMNSIQPNLSDKDYRSHPGTPFDSGKGAARDPGILAPGEASIEGDRRHASWDSCPRISSRKAQ